MVTLDDRPIFIDTNVLVYANILAYPLHQIATEQIQSLIDSGIELWLSRQVLREFIAAVTRPQTYGNPQPIEMLSREFKSFKLNFKLQKTIPKSQRNCWNYCSSFQPQVARFMMPISLPPCSLLELINS